MTKAWVCGSILAASLAIGTLGCAGSGGGDPYSRNGYTAVEKDGRLYVFLPNSGEHQRFKRGEEMAKSVTRVGAGPNRMTVIAEPDVNLDKYLGG